MLCELWTKHSDDDELSILSDKQRISNDEQRHPE